MKTQHTPGPWKVFRVKDGANKGKIIGIGDADAGGVTDPFGGLWRSGKELEANAELIAAAPDLLIACQRLVACQSGMPMSGIEAEQYLQDAVSTIAKALGQ